MTGRACRFPLIVRLRGVPDSARLAEMSDAIAQAVAGRLRIADRVMAAREGWPSWRRDYATPQLHFSGAALDDELQRRVAAAIETGIARAVAGGPDVATARTPSTPFVLAQHRPSRQATPSSAGAPRSRRQARPWRVLRSVAFQ